MNPGRPSRMDRLAEGKARRKAVPRTTCAAWEPAPGRDPLVPIDAVRAGRLPHLLSLRAERMVASPFAFYRGGAALMASDLATLPVSGITVQACGDAHLLNFGGFATPERNFIFDINDFDETLAGPWEWDVLRLAASIVLGGRERGFPKRVIRAALLASIRRYRLEMAGYAARAPLEVWYERFDESRLLGESPTKDDRDRRDAYVRRAQLHSQDAVLAKLTTGTGWDRRFVDDPPTIFHADRNDEVDLPAVFAAYPQGLLPETAVLFARYALIDTAVKVVGVGSVGTRCGVGLFTDGDDHWLVLQIKEAPRSALEPYLAPSPYRNQGQRVVRGQRLVQFASDIFLGWSTSGDHDFYVRQFRDMKTSVDLAALDEAPYAYYVEYCARALAMGHARSGDPAAIAGYLGASDVFDQAVLVFAERYADLTERDHALFAQREKAEAAKPAPAEPAARIAALGE